VVVGPLVTLGVATLGSFALKELLSKAAGASDDSPKEDKVGEEDSPQAGVINFAPLMPSQITPRVEGLSAAEEYSSELEVFERLRELQGTSTRKNREIYGHYYHSDDGYILILGDQKNATATGVDGFKRKAGTIPFHTHPSKTEGNKFNPAQNDLVSNLDDIPSEADLIAFLSAPNNEEVICTELFTIKLKKTKDTPKSKEIEDAFLNFCNKQVDLALQLLTSGAIHETFLYYHLSNLYSDTKQGNLPKYYNSSSFLRICREVFKLEVEIHSGENQKLSGDEATKQFAHRDLTPEEETQASNYYKTMQVIITNWDTFGK